MTADPVDLIARTLLYEGYLLYPYRRSALKNQQRFNFGVLHPLTSERARVHGDPWQMQAQCLVLVGVDTTLDVAVRFLQLTNRTRADAAATQAPALQEAVEREGRARRVTLDELGRVAVIETFECPAADAREPLRGEIALAAEPIDGAIPPCVKLTVRVSNLTEPAPIEPSTHDEALLRAFVSTHVALTLTSGAFVSLLDPPPALREAAGQCQNVGVWPVLVGEPGSTDRMLASPIILYDHPQIAPESAGDLFDGTEIDEILALRILTMTDEEKREMRETDDRARQILDRTEGLSEEHWQRLHGAVRGLRHVTGRRP